MRTLVTERLQRNEFADECRTHSVECQEIAEFHGGLIKEQYEALSRQWLAVAATAHGLVACNFSPQSNSRGSVRRS
jgi:hypothetical protein